MKITLIVACLEWLTCLFLFIMVEVAKLLCSPDLKMVLVFLVTKVFLQCSNEFVFHMRLDMSGNSRRQGFMVA